MNDLKKLIASLTGGNAAIGKALMAPVFIAGMKLKMAHVVAALAGFAGAAIAILGGGASGGGWAWGYLPALGSAFIWASYSLLTRRVAAFPTAAIGLFGLVSGVLSLVCHFALEPRVALSGQDWLLMVESTGAETLFDFYAKLVSGEALPERGDHAVF